MAPGATPLTFDAVFTVEGVASLDTVALREDVSPGAYTPRIADATPESTAPRSRCGEGHGCWRWRRRPGRKVRVSRRRARVGETRSEMGTA